MRNAWWWSGVLCNYSWDEYRHIWRISYGLIIPCGMYDSSTSIDHPLSTKIHFSLLFVQSAVNYDLHVLSFLSRICTFIIVWGIINRRVRAVKVVWGCQDKDADGFFLLLVQKVQEGWGKPPAALGSHPLFPQKFINHASPTNSYPKLRLRFWHLFLSD